MAGKQNDSCQMGCDEEVENYIDYLFSSVKDNQVLPFEKLINGEINPKNKCGCTPFHYAAKLGRLQICEFFLIHCNVKNPANLKGITPLHLAVGNEHSSLCRVMLIFFEILDLHHCSQQHN